VLLEQEKRKSPDQRIEIESPMAEKMPKRHKTKSLKLVPHLREDYMKMKSKKLSILLSPYKEEVQ